MKRFPFSAQVFRSGATPIACRSHSLLAFVAAGISLALLPNVHAVPSFARQMDSQCIRCHSEYPVLNEFGRTFKLTGYTMSMPQADLPPIAVMFMPSFTHTAADQAGGAAPHFGDNNNAALNQASVFYAGRLFGPFADMLLGKDAAAFADKFGIFSQTTYDGVGRQWAWDNTELRYADTASFGEHSAIWGLYLNNNPTLQDLWNTTPAWGFPFSGSALAPTPSAATLIDGGLAQQVAGLGAYAMFDNTFYADAGLYHTLGAHLQKSLGVDPSGETQIGGLAPYWRFALVKPLGPGNIEVGTFGLAADTYPGRDQSAGKDRIVDFGLDTEYQESIGAHDVTAMASFIDEHETWNANEQLGGTSNGSDNLRTFKGTVIYLYDKTYGASVQYFATDGDADPALYADSFNGSPKSDGFVFQANYLPFNKTTGPAIWPRSNVKLSLQYVAYNHFNGAKSNYDGAGRSAANNNTLYLEAWMAF